MELKDLLEISDNRIRSTDRFMWNCYGDNAVSIDFSDGFVDPDLSCVLTKDGHIAEATFSFVKDDRHINIKWYNPAYKFDYDRESWERGFDPDIAYDDYLFFTLGENHFLSVANEIFSTKDISPDLYEFCDNKYPSLSEDNSLNGYETIEVSLEKEELLALAMEAHERDITLNELVNNILREKLNAID